MGARNPADDERIRALLFVCVSFLLTSTGWLAWLYHIMDLDPTIPADAISLVAGYGLQALGAGVYILARRKWSAMRQDQLFAGLACSYIVLLVPSVLGAILEALVLGLVSNVICGAIQGCYLCLIAEMVDAGHRGVVFGCAYATSTLLSWVLTLPAGGALTRGLPCLALCFALAAASYALVRTCLMQKAIEEDPAGQTDPLLHAATIIPLACAVVFMVSTVKTAGFSFPAADVAAGVSIELSRLLYGAGLVTAGWVADRDRRLVMILCGAALVFPFLVLALSGAGVTGAPLWILAYVLTGFYVVFRMLLLMDLADGHDPSQAGVAALGFLFGRMGDAVGAALYLSTGRMPVVLIALTTVLFTVAVGLMLLLYQRLYLTNSATTLEPEPEPVAVRSERALFEDFAQRYGLTARERDVLRLLLAEKSNPEVAGELVVSEATVKYHVGNLLKKTGCKSRLEILAKYAHEC